VLERGCRRPGPLLTSDHDRSRWPVATLSLVVANVLIDLVTNLLNHEQIARQFGFVAAQPQQPPPVVAAKGGVKK
jgi:hypothetical protein